MVKVRYQISLSLRYFLAFSYFISKPEVAVFGSGFHIRRFQEYFNNIHIFIGSTTVPPKWCKYPILGSKTNRGDIRLYFKTYEKISRWRRCWNIWHLNLKTKIYPLVVRYQEFNRCQKNQKDLRNSDWKFIVLIFSQKWKKTWKNPKWVTTIE